MKSFLFLISCVTPCILFGQIPNWASIELETEVEIKHVGLDTLGFMWFSSKDKIYRFDGSVVEQKFALKDEIFTAMKNHMSGIFYFGTDQGRVLSYNPYENKIDWVQDSTYNNSISNLEYIDVANYLLVSYGNGIQLKQHGSNFHFSVENGLMSNELYEVQSFNNKYYVSNDQGIQVLDLSREDIEISEISQKDGLSDFVIPHLVSTSDKLWFGDYDSHVGYIDKQGTIEYYPLPKQGRINDLYFDQTDLYVATDHGLFVFVNGMWQQKYPKQGSEKVELVQRDEEDNLWILNGKNFLGKGNLTFQKLDFELENIRAISKTSEVYHIGTDKGLFVYKNEAKRKISDDNITCLKSHGEYILAGTFSNGIKVFDRDQKLVDQRSKWFDVEDQSILAVHPHQGFVYVSSLTGVMRFHFEEGKLIEDKSFNSIIGQGYMYSIFSVGQTLFFGTDRKGLIIWDSESNKIDKISEFKDGQKIGSVYSIAKDRKGKIWFVSTEKGIGYIDGETCHYWPKSPNVKDEYTCISAVADGKLLLVRSGSIDLLNPRSNHLASYNKEFGLKEETAYLNAVTSDEENTFFVHDDNIYIYSSKENQKINPQIIIDKVSVNLSEIRKMNSFDQDENNIEFLYKAAWLSSPLKLSYQYKLEGFDEEWRDTKDNTVSFPKLQPGHYTFKVRASENSLFENEPEAIYQFQIKKHFYNLWWVRLLTAFILGALIWRIWQNRENRKKEKLDLERLNIENQLIGLKNQLNPHFLFNAFNTLVGLIEEDSDRSVAFVEGMTDFYRNILKLGDKDLIPLKKEVEMLEQYLAILKERFKGQIIFDTQLDSESQLQIPPLTLQLLIENAVKHNQVSSKSPLKVSLVQKENEITIWNAKNVLISKAKSTHTGLENIKRRFELAGLPLPVICNEENYFEVVLNLEKS